MQVWLCATSTGVLFNEASVFPHIPWLVGQDAILPSATDSILSQALQPFLVCPLRCALSTMCNPLAICTFSKAGGGSPCEPLRCRVAVVPVVRVVSFVSCRVVSCRVASCRVVLL